MACHTPQQNSAVHLSGPLYTALLCSSLGNTMAYEKDGNILIQHATYFSRIDSETGETIVVSSSQHTHEAAQCPTRGDSIPALPLAPSMHGYVGYSVFYPPPHDVICRGRSCLCLPATRALTQDIVERSFCPMETL